MLENWASHSKLETEVTIRVDMMLTDEQIWKQDSYVTPATKAGSTMNELGALSLVETHNLSVQFNKYDRLSGHEATMGNTLKGSTQDLDTCWHCPERSERFIFQCT